MADVFRHAWWAFAQVYYDLRALAIRGNLWWFVTVFPLFPIVGIPLASALQQAMVGIDGPVTGIVFFVFIVEFFFSLSSLLFLYFPLQLLLHVLS